jgi:hypothetical protein
MHCVPADGRRGFCGSPSFALAIGCLLTLALAKPALALPPALPTIPPGITNIASFGATGDGVSTNTTAIQNAINAASAAGIGTVEIPAGTFLSGPLAFANNLNLQLDAGATLLMLPFDKYPGGDVSPPNFIAGSSLHDVEISGSGVIEGQGLPWWKDSETNSAAVRPNMINFSACTRVLIQDVTLSNSPSPFMVVKGKAGNVTIQRVKVYAPSSGASPNPSHNTDAIDLAETNAVIRDCIISTGDDNVAVGSSASVSSDILITNCTFGFGHGVSIGSFTSGGVSNMTVINCTFTNTDQGIRIKSDRDRGGTVQNLGYYNLSMGNVQYPILIYCYYTNTTFGSINNLTPATVSTAPTFAVTSKTPIYRNITISNVVGSAQSGRMAGLIWGLPEMLITNITLNEVALTGSKTFGIYYASGIKLIDSAISVPSTVNSISVFDAQVVFTNSTPSGTVTTLDGASTNSFGNNFSFFNALASLKNTNALRVAPSLSLASSTFTISNHLNLDATSKVNFTLGANAATVVVRSNLALAGTISISPGSGFTNGSYTLFTYGSGLTWNVPALGSSPSGYNYSFDTNTSGQVKLLVALPAPSLAPVSLAAQSANGQIIFSWPADHIGWKLQTQTNGPDSGLSSNWVDVLNSGMVNRVTNAINASNGSVFFRLAYP